jgi:predicted dehydrogenase
MSDEKVRVGVVGVGGMGSGHCKSIQGLDEIELTCVADVNEARANEIAEQYEVKAFTAHTDLIGSGLVDAVVIATPHYFHPPVAIDAFAAGLHVLSEKPIGVRIGEAEKMVAAAKESGKVFAVMFQMRTTAAVKKAKEIAEAGELGEIKRTLLISPEFRSQAYYNSGTWRATWAGEGGGVMLNQAPHIMDVFCMLGGLPSRVHGRCQTLIHDIEVEDQAQAMLEYGNGAVGYFYVSTCETGPRMLEIVGDKGRLRLAGGGLSFTRFSPAVTEFNKTNTEMWGSPKSEDVDLGLEDCEHGHHVVLRNFARAILHGEPLVTPGEVGVKSLELANAIILSSYKGEPVDVPIDRSEYYDLVAGLAAKSGFKDDWGASKSETDPQFKK